MNQLSLLYDPKMITRTAFFTGFLNAIKFKTLMTYPLSNILGASINASLSAVGTELVINLIPESLRPVVPVALIASSIYYLLGGKKSTAPAFRIKCTTNNNTTIYEGGVFDEVAVDVNI